MRGDPEDPEQLQQVLDMQRARNAAMANQLGTECGPALQLLNRLLPHLMIERDDPPPDDYDDPSEMAASLHLARATLDITVAEYELLRRLGVE